jgi:hypothetical protein
MNHYHTLGSPNYGLIGVDGTLPCIDYEGIDLVWSGTQDFFEDGFQGAEYLGKALKAGLRGDALIPPLFSDFHVWQAYPPDRCVLLLSL